jgi:hypothetical protein
MLAAAQVGMRNIRPWVDIATWAECSQAHPPIEGARKESG